MCLIVVVIPLPIRLRRAVWGGFTKSNHEIEMVLNDKFIHSKYRREISESNLVKILLLQIVC